MKLEKSTIVKIGFVILTILIAGMVFASLAEDLVNRESLSTMTQYSEIGLCLIQLLQAIMFSLLSPFWEMH